MSYLEELSRYLDRLNYQEEARWTRVEASGRCCEECGARLRPANPSTTCGEACERIKLRKDRESWKAFRTAPEPETPTQRRGIL